MRRVACVALVALLLSSAAFAQNDNMIGMFFTNDLAAINDGIDAGGPHPDTNFPNTFTPFFGYIVLVNPTVDSVAAYECSLELSDPSVFLLGVTGPNGWTNFGSQHQPPRWLPPHRCRAPRWDRAGQRESAIHRHRPRSSSAFGPSEPSSFGPDGPAIANGADPR